MRKYRENTGRKDREFSRSRSMSNFYALIGQNLTGEFMQKIHTASWNLFTLTAEADRVFCQLVMFFTVFFHWMHKMKYSCYQQSSVIHDWFVYWIFGWEVRRLSKFEIRFRMTSFSFFTLLDTGWKVPQAILALLGSLGAVSRMASLSNYCIECMCLFFISNFISRAQFMRLVYALLY